MEKHQVCAYWRNGAALRPASKFALACSQIIESAMADPALTDVKHRPKPDLSVPAPEVCVLRPLLDRRAAETPNKVFAKFVDGTFWTYRTMLDVTLKTAAALQALGVRQGDRVLSWLPNGGDALRVWFGLNYIGAVYAPINLAYKGSLLQHVVRNSDARLLVAHGDLVGRLADIDPCTVETVVALGGAPAPLTGIELRGPGALDCADVALKPLDRPIDPWDTQSIIYTSGTTDRPRA